MYDRTTHVCDHCRGTASIHANARVVECGCGENMRELTPSEQHEIDEKVRQAIASK